MKRVVGAVSFVSVVAIAGAAAAATTLRYTWSAPDAQPGTFRGKKVVTLFVSPDEQERRGVEGLLADELTKRGAQGVPAVALIPAEEIRAEAKVRPRLAAAGVAGAVVFRLVAEDRKLGHLGTEYGNDVRLPGETLGWAGTAYAPHLITRRHLRRGVGASSDQNSFVRWAGQSSTGKPRADKIVRECRQEGVAAEMQKKAD